MPVGGVQGGAGAGFAALQRQQNTQLQDPKMRYKLDLGEPGLATPARASDSILQVISHEQQNMNRFRAQAAREGGYVIYGAITLNLAYQGSFMAAQGGLSTARVIYPNGREPYFGAGGPAQTPFDNLADEARMAGGAANAPAAAGGTNGPAAAGEEEEEENAGGFIEGNEPVSGQQLDGLKKAARAELQRLDRFLRRDTYNQEGSNNAVAVRGNATPPPAGVVATPAPPPADGTDEAAEDGAPQVFQADENQAADQAGKQRANAIRTQIESALQRLEQIDRFEGDQGVQKAQEQIMKAVEDMMKLTFGMARAARGGREGEKSPAEEMQESKGASGTSGIDAGSQAQSAVASKLNTLLNSLGSLMSGGAIDALA